MTLCCSPALNYSAFTLRVVPCTGGQAAAYVAKHHRHLQWVSDRCRFACGLAYANPHELVGVGIVANGAQEWEGTGRATITRTATPGIPNGSSMILGALSRAARELGYVEVWTYTLPEEPGTSLRAAGFVDMGLSAGGEHDRPSRPRKAAVRPEQKRRWVRRLSDTPHGPVRSPIPWQTRNFPFRSRRSHEAPRSHR